MVEEDLLDIINRPEHRKEFGKIVRFLRARHKHTLRSLAHKVNLSHAHLRKIETGATQITSKSFDRLDAVLHLDLCVDMDLKKKFHRYERLLEQGIEYFDSDKLLESVEKLEENDVDHRRSLWMVDYYLAKLAFHNFTLFRHYGGVVDIASDLSQIEKVLSEPQWQRLFLYRGVYNYNANDLQNAISDFQTAWKHGTTRWIRATACYFIGTVYSESYHLPKSNLYLDEAIQMFEEDKNTFRLMHAQVKRTGNRIRIGHIENVEEDLKTQKQFAQSHRLDSTYYNIQMNETLYHILREDYDAALSVLDDIEDKTPGYYFYRAYSHLQKNDCEKALENIVTVTDEQNPHNRRYFIHRYSLAFIEAYCQSENHEYEDALRRFLDEAMSHRAYFETRVAYDYMVNLLQAQRRYKEAFQLTQRMIDITKTALC